MTANEYYGWLSFGEGMALWRELYERFDAVPFYAGSSGEQAGGWFTRPIDTIEDFKGLKIRIAGLARLVLERLGAEAVLLPPSEIAAAM
ncbi:MAG: ABC transporter substrate-binding protein, partial [Rhodospirillaceae bacterium]|nr:ABC transporter substrate-binding protein [Rhodospirillaceae bacterium]